MPHVVMSTTFAAKKAKKCASKGISHSHYYDWKNNKKEVMTFMNQISSIGNPVCSCTPCQMAASSSSLLSGILSVTEPDGLPTRAQKSKQDVNVREETRELAQDDRLIGANQRLTTLT